jgi:hypothetical protein
MYSLTTKKIKLLSFIWAVCNQSIPQDFLDNQLPQRHGRFQDFLQLPLKFLWQSPALLYTKNRAGIELPKSGRFICRNNENTKRSSIK